MAHSLSAQKRVRQNEKCRVRNRSAKSAMKTEVKKFLTVVGDGDVAAADAALRVACRALDKAASKGVVHKRTAARQKSRLSARLNAAKAPQEA
ncbi:30S ribosomal protein S20 [bacterium]|nr:30S ribosomal protein S20 [bacterium]